MAVSLQIVNPDPRYSRVRLIQPTTFGYLHLAAVVRPRRIPFLPAGREKSALLAKLKELAREVERLDSVLKATVYDAVAFAPPSSYVKERLASVRVARFDVVVLIEAASPTVAQQLQTTPAYQVLLDTLRSSAEQIHVLAALNAKRVGDVNKRKKGTFLFNYFVGDDPGVVMELWDHLAGWYEVETGMDNSTLLAPLPGEDSDYVIINHARWDGSPLSFVVRQFSKPSVRSYMMANLAANRVGAMAVLYRLA